MTEADPAAQISQLDQRLLNREPVGLLGRSSHTTRQLVKIRVARLRGLECHVGREVVEKVRVVGRLRILQSINRFAEMDDKVVDPVLKFDFVFAEGEDRARSFSHARVNRPVGEMTEEVKFRGPCLLSEIMAVRSGSHPEISTSGAFSAGS